VTITRRSAASTSTHSDLNLKSAKERTRQLIHGIRAHLPWDPFSSNTLAFPVRGFGYVYEIEEVVRCLREGLMESPVMTQHETLLVMEVLGNIRNILDTQNREASP